MILAIEANNIRSDGGIQFLKNIIQEIKFSKRGLEKIYIWGEEKLLTQLPNSKFIIKEKILLTNINFINIVIRLFWHIFIFKILIQKKKCDIVYFPGGINISGIKKSKTIISILNLEPFFHDFFYTSYFSFKKLRLLILKKIILISSKKSSGVIFLNNYFKNFFKKNYNTNIISAICNIGVKINKGKLKKQKKITKYSKKNRFVLGYISTIFSYKNHLQTILAVQKLIHEGLPVSFVMIGQNHDNLILKKIKKLIRNEKYIKYLGYLSRQQLDKYYKNKIDLKIFSSRCEAFPNILLEAANFNLPIACSNFEPMPSILGKNCIYFNPNLKEDIYRKIKLYLNNPKLRTNNIKKTKQMLINKYSWKKSSNNFIKFIKLLNDNN